MTNYRHEMFDRLEPRSEFKGGRIVDTDLLTLTEAASMATRHAGEPVNVGDILRAAGRGEILLRAIIHRRVKLQSHDGGICCNQGHPTDENVAPAGCIPTLPLSACKHLANNGRASWRTFDGYTEIDGVTARFDKWTLTDDEPDIETTLEDCRVTGRDVHALADAFAAMLEQTTKDQGSEQNQLAEGHESPPLDRPWKVTKPKKFQGYGRPLYELLASAKRAGYKRPTAADVLSVWRENKPPEVSKVLVGAIEYWGANGNLKEASSAAIGKAIGRMTDG